MENSRTIFRLVLCIVAISTPFGPASQADDQTGAARLLQATGWGQQYEGIVDWQIETQNKLCPPEELGGGEGDAFAIDRASLQATYEEVVTEQFSNNHIENLVAFFASPLGSRFVHENSSIESRGTEVVDQALAYWRRDSLVALGRPIESLYLFGLPERPGPSEAAPNEFSQEHRIAAASLFEISPWRSALNKSLERGVSAYKDLVVSSETLPAPVQERLARTRDWDRIVEELTMIVARSFTGAEIRELLVFFSSPSGKYFVSVKEQLDMRLLEETNKALRDRQRKLWDAGC